HYQGTFGTYTLEFTPMPGAHIKIKGFSNEKPLIFMLFFVSFYMLRIFPLLSLIREQSIQLRKLYCLLSLSEDQRQTLLCDFLPAIATHEGYNLLSKLELLPHQRMLSNLYRSIL